MGVSSYFEFVTVLFGWVVYDRLWAVLNDTGIVYLPFFAIVARNVMESRRGGDDEGSAAIQSLKKSEVDVVVALVVLFLAAV
ncbi:MAG: conjugal transfer protein TraG, partial [Chloroflexota bacterium]|nr:conjugal transfer protein TraG [Chloroflexota bacterium]